MPKIIENIRERLLEEARRQVMEQGYSAMTIRSVATACGVGTGTIYNYFPSKDTLIVSFMLEDWKLCVQTIEAGFANVKDNREALYVVYEELLKYKEKYNQLFLHENKSVGYTVSFMQRHIFIRDQLAEPIKSWTSRQEKVDADFLADFIAENMLNWTMEGREFELIASALLQLF